MFLFHHMTALPIKDEVKVIDSLTDNHVTDQLFELSEELRRNKDPTVSVLRCKVQYRHLTLHGLVPCLANSQGLVYLT